MPPAQAGHDPLVHTAACERDAEEKEDVMTMKKARDAKRKSTGSSYASYWHEQAGMEANDKELD